VNPEQKIADALVARNQRPRDRRRRAHDVDDDCLGASAGVKATWTRTPIR